MRKIIIWIVCFILIALSGMYFQAHLRRAYEQLFSGVKQIDTHIKETILPPSISSPPNKYVKIHNEAYDFIMKNNLNAQYYILIDMSIHSGKNRLFVYDFKKQENTSESLVTHGACDVFEKNPDPHTQVRFSNQMDSHCSSLGKYKIGKRDYSGWGIKIKYWLHGLETSNDNAQKRVVVLHSWEAVGDEEVYPYYSPLSWGCPAVSNQFLKVLDAKFKSAQKPPLLWII